MSKKNEKTNRASKKEMVAGSDKKGGGSSKALPTVVVIALTVAVVLGVILFGGPGDKFTRVEAADGAVRIAINDVSDGQAHYFKHNVAGKDVKFFVVKSSDGIIRAAFDACDVCYPEKKGYRQEGDWMVCNNCGQRFASVKVNVLKGGCNPSPLTREVQGDYLVMNVRDIASGSRYF